MHLPASLVRVPSLALRYATFVPFGGWYWHQRIGAFELWCWRRLSRVPWTARRSNPSILKEISPGCSLEGLMLKLKLQYFGHLMQRVDSLEKTLMLGRGWGQEGKGMTEDEMVGWHHQLDGHEFEQTPAVGDGQGGLACCDSWGCKESDTTEWLNWQQQQQKRRCPSKSEAQHCRQWTLFKRKRHFKHGLMPSAFQFLTFFPTYWSDMDNFRNQQRGKLSQKHI